MTACGVLTLPAASTVTGSSWSSLNKGQVQVVACGRLQSWLASVPRDGLARYLDIGSTKKIPKIGLGAHQFGSQEWE